VTTVNVDPETGEILDIDGDLPPERAPVTVDEGLRGAGTFALASLAEDEFEGRLEALVNHRRRIQKVQRALMTKDVHYGVLPGTDKPTLLQPGAELLCDVYRLRARFRINRSVGDGETAPHLSYLTECFLHLGSLDGPVVAHATGAANSWEKRYRYRSAERNCPNCGKPAVIKGKKEYGGGWLCWPKKDGCNSKWPDGDAAIEGQTVGQVDNPDPFDLDVVLDAMAAKRAFVHATRRGCAVSDLFTSDVEDLPEFQAPHEPERSAPKTRETHREPVGPEQHDGTVAVGKPPVDCELRETPTGMATGFSLQLERGRMQVLAFDDLAAVLQPNLAGLVGQTVTVWGKVEAVPWDKDGKAMPPYRRMVLERIQTPEWTLPAQDGLSSEQDQAELDAAAEGR
jgi:hypothetical protein